MAGNPKLNLTNEGTSGIFHTIQCEGRYTGTPSVFVRLSGCNLRCAWVDAEENETRCDTPHSSFDPEHNLRAVADIIQQVQSFNCRHVVITGGEPMLQPGIVDFIDGLAGHHFITVETNATMYRLTRAQFISMSPKLSSSCHAKSQYYDRHQGRRLNLDAIRQYATRHDYQCKFVINLPGDMQEALRIQDQCGLDHEKIYLMPQGVSAEQLNKKAAWVMDLCKKYRFQYSDRMHIRVFGNRGGV